MNPDVFVYSEDSDVAAEILNPAQEIAHSIGGKAIQVLISKLGSDDTKVIRGADAVLRVGVDDRNYEPTPELIAKIIGDLCKQRGVNIVLIGSTKDGKEVAGRLAVQLDAAVSTDCLGIKLQNDKLIVERVVYGGRVVSKGVLEAGSFVVAVKPRAYARLNSGANPPIEEMNIQPPPVKVKIVKSGEIARGTVDLTKAEKIVAVGRGLKKKEDLEIIQQLADALGASVGCSRPLSSDLGWLPEDAHIGLTGVQVKPKLYVAVGISGQLQHLAGIKDSKLIVAINSDKSAPIFQNCDYGAVGDLYQVVPELVKLLKARK